MYPSLINSAEQEFFFLISPPPHIKNAVALLKEDIQTVVGHELIDRYSKPHISLFKCGGKHIETMLQYARSKAAYVKPFNIFLKNFNAFRQGSSSTIYLDIINKYPISDIFKELVTEEISFTPQITLTKNIDIEDFKKTWSYLKDFSYSQHFLCDRITVLTREQTKWIHYKDIMFDAL